MAGATLYTFEDSFRAQKVQVAAKYSGFSLTVKQDASAASRFPLGRLPALETADGVTLNDSNAIAYYVANEQMRGTTVADAAMIQQYMNFAENEIAPAMCTWVFPCLGIMQYNKQNTERAKEEVKAVLQVLNERLRTRTYLVGERVTLADISVATNLVLLYKMVLEPSFRAPYTHVNRWFNTITNQPQFKEVVQFTLCTKAAQFDAKKFAENQPKKEGGKKKEAPKKKEPAPKKEAPKKEAPAEDEAPEFPKAPKDPFSVLPAGSFIMDEFKRTYRNHDFDTVTLPYLKDNFDAANYSMWYCSYDHPSDLSSMCWMNENLINGMFQRLEQKMIKHAMGMMSIFKEEKGQSISGVWIWRGTGLAFDLSPELQGDHDSYTWTKLDYSKAEDKAKVAAYWTKTHEGKERLASCLFV